MRGMETSGVTRATLLCAGSAVIAVLTSGAAAAQGYYPGPNYPPPAYPPGYGYAPSPQAPAYQAYQQPDPRYQDPRYADPRYRAWLDRYYSQGYDQRYGQAYAQPTYPPSANGNSAPAAPAAAAPQAAVQAASPVPMSEAASMPPPHLPHRLIEAAQAYANYIKRTSAIDAGFQSGASVAEAVKTGAAYEARQFQEGAIAYAALTALQEPSFVQGARQLLREGDHGADFCAQLAADPDAALNIRGADLAAARAATALRRHGANLVNAGANVKQAAYTVQHADWSKAQVLDPDGRLAAAKASSARRAELTGDDAPELTKAVLAETTGDGQAPSSSVVTRALAIAALAALGQLQSDDDPHLTALLQEPKSADCLKMAKLNLFQCLAVARPHYEDIFCLGEHGMMETGQCVVKAAGFTPVPVTAARGVASASGRR
jgi:hypothetical protein